MKRFISLVLTFAISFGVLTYLKLPVSAISKASSEQDFTDVSYTDVYYGYTWYLMHYNDVMRKPITDSIINAGEQFNNLDDQFFASLETSLKSVGSFSKTFYAITDAIGVTSKMNNESADKAITDVLKNIYEDETSEFWSNVVNKESASLKALKNSLSFIDNFNKAFIENHTLEEQYDNVLQQSINKTCEFDVAIGKLNIKNRTEITNTFYKYYKDDIKDWEHIVKLTKCINTILFYQNVEVDLIDYILAFDDLDEDLIKGLKRIKSNITTNYATYIVETITKEVIDNILDKIGDFFGFDEPIVKLISIAGQFTGWLFFDVIWKHPSAEEYITYIYLVKFLYSAQYEMNKKLIYFNTDLVYSDTIDDFEYFYKIYTSIFKSGKKYAEQLLGKTIEYEYNDCFFKCPKFIDYIRNEVKKINVDERVEKATITNKKYEFNKPIIVSDNDKDTTCLVTFHNRILAPLVIDKNVEYDNCDLIVPELTISRSLTINNNITVEGDYYSGSVAGGIIAIGAKGLLDVKGDAYISAGNHGANSVSTFTIDSGGQFNVKNLTLKGNQRIGYGENSIHLYVYGELNIYNNFYSNSLIKLFDYNIINVGNNVNFSAEVHWTYVTNGWIYIYENANFFVNGDFSLKGSNCYNTGNNWFHLCLYGNLTVNGDFSASNRFVSLNQYSSNSVWIVNGDFCTDALNESIIYGFGIGYEKGYVCNLNAGQLVLKGNYLKTGGVTITPSGSHTIILEGTTLQNIEGINAGSFIINNTEGVVFTSPITVTKLFNHNGHPFTLYDNGTNSTFVDYDNDGLKDNVDSYPTVGNPCSVDIHSEDIEKGTVSEERIETFGGAEVTVTATPTYKYRFSKWIDASGATVSTSPEYTFIVKEDASLTAVFSKRTQIITRKASGGYIVAPFSVEIESRVENIRILENAGYIYVEGSLKYNGITVENNSFIMPDSPVVLTAEFLRNDNYFALKDKINQAKSYDCNDYSSASFAILTSAIENAEKALNNHITASESAGQIENLQNAIDLLSSHDHVLGEYMVTIIAPENGTGEKSAVCQDCHETVTVQYSVGLYGDADGDGCVNAEDIMLLGRYLAGADVDGMNVDAVNVHNLKIGSSKKPNQTDLTRLIRFVAGWQGYTFSPF